MSEARTNSERERRARLVALAEASRRELHRYCARLVGSVIDGEDVVQDSLARALTAIDDLDDATPLRPWLFRIAHNRALDVLRGRAVCATEPIEAAHLVADPQSPDPLEALVRKEAVDTAVARFVELPTVQRSVVILKDVLDQSLEEIAALLDLTVNAVKAHLARGRAALKVINANASVHSAPRPPSLAAARYVAMFNGRDWDGLRALLADDVRLNQATYPPRAGRADVGLFFGIYAGFDGVWLAPAWLDGTEVIAVFADRADTRPSYFMILEWRDGQISLIRDFRYVRYVAEDADFSVSSEAVFPLGEAPVGGPG